MTGRKTLLCGTTLVLAVIPSALGTASASARTVRSHSVSSRTLAVHRAENRWHLHQMDGHRATFGALNRSVHRRVPLAGPAADRALQATHAIHEGMGWADDTFLAFHERFATR